MSRQRKRTKHVSGFVSILGRPNSGKSTLLNALVGEKLAIVSDKPQTTRTTIQGVWTTPESQVVFLDTPGIHAPDSIINRRMMQSISEALDERDLLLYLADVTRAPGAEEEQAIDLVKNTGTPAFAVLTKIDLLDDKARLLPLLERFRQIHQFEEFLPVSAVTGVGMDELRKAVVARMPRGPAWFPEDFVTDQPERFLGAEIIREKILALTRHEVPHSVAVVVDEWKEEGRLLRISATIHVERPGQKGIVLGAGGALLKRIGSDARLELEGMLCRKVFLSLFVKVSPRWRENESFLQELDWRAMLGGSDQEHNSEG